MELTKRLNAAVKMVDIGANVADIGTDHGYVPIYLKKNNIAGRVIAMDINEGPLNKAKGNILANGLMGEIEVRLSDGLKGLMPGEADTIIIGGMGGDLMIKILLDSKETTGQIKTLILQPQSEIKKVREFLIQSGRCIVKEDMVLEDGKYYPLMKAVKGETSLPYTEEEYHFGRCLLKEKNHVLFRYLLYEEKVKNQILRSLLNTSTEKGEERRKQVLSDLKVIEKAKKYYE